MGINDRAYKDKRKRGDLGPEANPNKMLTERKTQFVRGELDRVQAAECKSWVGDGDDLLGYLDTVVMSGYKLSIRWDGYSESYAAWLIAPDKDSTNAGLILPGRGSTPSKSVRQVLFKHIMMFDGVWPKQDSKQDFDLDD